MRCRRICRELLWLTRFGELGPSSQPHLDHLAGCRSCRDEVGFDRAMVEQLRIALAARIDGAVPSPTAWDRILARAQAPEPPAAARLWEWSSGLVGRLRMATAMAGTGLALVLALNTQIVGIPGADSSTDWERTTLEQVPRMPRVEASSIEDAGRTEGAGSTTNRPDPEEVTLTTVGRPSIVAQAEAEEPAVEEPSEAAPTTQLRLVVRPMQTPEPGTGGAATANETEGSTWRMVPTEPGEPS